MTIEIRPLVVGWITVDRSRLLPSGPATEIEVPAIAWLVRVPGGNILVDTGPGDPETAHSRGHRSFRRAPDESLCRALSRVDVHPDDIGTVVLTHLHWDHAGELSLFPSADVLVQRAEVEFSRCPTPDQRDLYDTPPRAAHPLESTRYEELDGTSALRPDIDLVRAPGHTPGSQMLSVATPGGRFIIAGDTVPLAATLADVDPVPSTIATDDDALRRSLRSLASLGAIVLPAHEPALAAFDGADLTEHEEELCALWR